MNAARAKELLPVFQAFAEGKQIQVRLVTVKDWQDCPEPGWSDNCHYRIKPEAIELWVVIFPETAVQYAYRIELDAKSHADRFSAHSGQIAKIIHVKEVL